MWETSGVLGCWKVGPKNSFIPGFNSNRDNVKVMVGKMLTSAENTEQPAGFHLLWIQSKTSVGSWGRQADSDVDMPFNLKVETYGNNILCLEPEKPKWLDSLAHYSVSELLLLDKTAWKRQTNLVESWGAEITNNLMCVWCSQKEIKLNTKKIFCYRALLTFTGRF